LRNKLIVLAIAVVAAGLRLYGALVFPFEQDELYTIDEAGRLFHTRLLPGIQARPVFFILEHPLVTWFPHTPLVLRVLPLIFGILGVFLTWLLARRYLGERASIVAAVLVAVSPWHLYASGFARYYAMLYDLAALVYWLLPRAYDSDRPRDYLWAAAALLLGAWTHPSFVFPVAAAALAVMTVDWEGQTGWRWPSSNAWRWLWIPFVGASVVVAALIKAFTKAPSTVANGGDRGVMATLRLIPAMVDWMTLTVFVLALVGAVVLLQSKIPGRRQLGLMSIFGTGGMLVALFVLSFVTAIYADYGIAALPLILVGAAGLFQWVEDAVMPQQQRSVMWALALLTIAGVFPSAVSYLSDGTRFDYRPVFSQIDREGGLVTVLTKPIVLQRFYAPQLHAVELPSRPSQLDSLLERDHDLWVVTSVKRYGISGDDSHAVAGWLSGHCRPRGSYQRPRLDYRVYRVDLWRCGAGT